MTTTYEIPLTPAPQFFNINLGGTTYKLSLVWNNFSNSWTIDILDSSSNKIISGIPLVVGADLLAPFPYLNFGGTLTCKTDGDANAIPTYENLGISSHLLFTTTP